MPSTITDRKDDMSDLSKLQACIDRDEAQLRAQPGWPGGWPGEIEAALIDAVFSIRARYGSPTSGVRAVVERWRTERHTGKVDDLREIVERSEDDLSRVFGNASTTGGQTKSAAVRQAAVALIEAGISTSADMSVDTRAQAGEAYTSVQGLGWVTFSYFAMLLGVPGFKADVHICDYVASAVHLDTVSPERAYELLDAATSKFESKTHLDHAIWQLQRKRSGS